LAFFVILSLILTCDLLVAVWIVRRAPGKVAAAALGGLAALPLLHLVWMFAARSSALRMHDWVPMPLIAFSYLWNLIIAPGAAIAIGVSAAARRVVAVRPPKPPDLSRRRFLAASAAFVPPLAAGATLGIALPRLGDFRVRRLVVPVPGLPERLDGAVIAHVSDLHYGKFTLPADVDRMVDAVNGFEADLVLFTGDLIDLSLGDLPAALEALGRLRARGGLFACEGNHDLIDDGESFRRRVREAGVELLLDEARTVEVRGERVRIHGVTWARDQGGRREGLARARGLREEGAFPILLAHHPHAFDEAEGFPLTFSGHTHGGMLMWNERLGAGPILYRYWSGHYVRGSRSLVVSNGIGNWFPLRTHAPAEIVHVTLTRSPLG
jgi:predicted MPP superfamily phosphohydrolase